MKIINILFCILIFILAALSAVSSYFLYEKREQMIKGWDKMAQSINTTAKALDKGAGTKTAETLSAASLGHINYAGLDSKLPALQKQAETIVKQRDDLVKSIRQIAGIMESEYSGTNEDFQNIEKYAGSSSKVVKAITDIKERQDDCLNNVAKIAKKVSVNMSLDDLKGSDYRSHLNKFSGKISELSTRRNVFDSWVSKIAQKVNVSSSNLRGSGYTVALQSIYGGVEKVKNELDSTKKQLSSAKKQINNFSNKVNTKDKYIASLNSKISAKDEEIGQLKKIISGVENVVIPTPWPDGSKQVRSATKGNVVEVSRKFGFVVVDLGSSSSVKQRIGKKINYVNPKVKTGDEFVVIRNLDGGSPQFIGKIKLVKVDENCSIANIVAGSTDGDIKVGDSVVFSSTI